MARRPNAQQDNEHLDRLQRDSWNLELIISGLALFGLAAAGKLIEERLYAGSNTGGELLSMLFTMGLATLYFAGNFIFVNLIVHLLLRGLWIGALGLRSVSGDIQFYKLRLAPVFDRYLKKRISSFDDYIQRLDEWASLVFAFSFLSALSMIGFFGFFAFLLFFTNLIRPLIGPQVGLFFNLFFAFTVLLIIMGGLLYLLDFISLGRIKRVRWFSRLYYPVYRFFGWITFAWVYRPLYYNFIDNRFSRRILAFAIPYICLVLFLTSIRSNINDYYSWMTAVKINAASDRVTLAKFYGDVRDPEDDPGDVAIEIPSEIIREPVLPVKLTYYPAYDEVIAERCPDLPILRGFRISTDFIDGVVGPAETGDGLAEKLMGCLAESLQLQLDGRPVSLDDLVLRAAEYRQYPALIKFLPLDTLEKGLHHLRFTTYEVRGRTKKIIEVDDQFSVPFYYYPEETTR